MISNLKSQISDSLWSSVGDIVRNHPWALWTVPAAIVGLLILLVRWL
jgi:hypothetical protein